MLVWMMLVGCSGEALDTDSVDRYADLDFAPAGPDAAPDPMAWGPFPVGVTTIWLTDPARTEDDGSQREIPVEVWYPAASRDGEMRSYAIADFVPESRLVAEGIDASSLPILDSSSLDDVPGDFAHGPYPLVVFSHGNGSMRLQSLFFTEYLASHGYVVAAPDHVGNTLYEMLAPDSGGATSSMLESLVGRPEDIALIVERLRGSDDIVPVSDGPWGMSGHSLGAVTTLRVAAELDDVAVAVAQSPADISLALLGTGEEADDLEMPIFLQAGTEDRILNYEENAVPTFAALASGPTLMGTYYNAGHFSFTDLCVLDLGAVQELIYDSVGNVMQDGCGPENPDPTVALPVMRFHAIGMINGVLRDSPESTARMLAGPPEAEQQALFTLEGSL